MSRFNIKKAQSGFEGWSGEQKILAEQGEVFKTPDGQIQKISNNAPSHDDEMRINKFGINKVNKGDGGVEIDADSVLSDSYRQVENGNREHNVKEQIVKIKPIEGESIAGQLGLDIRLKKAVSPSQLFLEIQKVKDKQVLKILGKSKNFINNRESANSNNINRSQISALPTDEEIYDAVFDYVENKKDESGIDFEEEAQAQYGGEINSLEDDYFDNPLRNMINKIKNTPLYQDWKKIDNQYPTAKDKLSALTALTALAPNPYIKYGSLAINTGLDLIGNEMNDKVDLASNIMQIAGKKHQLPLRIGGQILGTSMDIINPSDDKFKVKKKQYGGSSILSQLGLIEKLPKAQSGVTTNPRDFLYTKEELNGNDYKINKRLEQCKTGNCLEETNLYFDKYVSPRLSIPNSNELKEKYNISSGRNHSRYNEYGESADSWDIHGLLKEKGHVNYTGEDVNKVDLNSLPIGTLLGYGENESVNNAYNKKKNLSSSRHSARVIGYDEKGIPIVYDYNQLLRIGDSGLGFKLNNITIPNEYKKYTRKYLADNNLLEEKITPLKINYKGKTNYDEDEFLPFKNDLETFKDKYMDVLGISNNSYNEFARQAVAMALAESKGGDDTIIRMKGIIPIPTYLTERFNPFAKTKGITQLNVDNLFKDERIAKRLKALNITEDNYDPYKSTHIVPATLLYLKYINSELDKNTTPLSRIEKVAYRNVAPKFFKKKPNEAKGDFKPVKNYKKEYDAIELK